jgi:hypothetical protein
MTIPATFLQEYGLFNRCATRGWDVWTAETLTCPPLQLHCSTCGMVRTWLEREKDRQFVPAAPKNEQVSGRIVAIRYVCGGCSTEFNAPPPQSVSFLVYFGQDEVDAEELNDPRYSVTQAAEAYAEATFAMKVGQYPPPDIRIPNDLQKRLGGYVGFFRQARISEQHGFGIGAFAYYRRIVEDTIDKLLQDIRSEFVSDEDKAEFDEQLIAVAQSRDASSKIEVVKHLVPEEGGGNSLGLLYKAMSTAIHELSDEQCLALAAATREVFIDLHERIKNKRKRGRMVADARRHIEKALGKDKKKS